MWIMIKYLKLLIKFLQSCCYEQHLGGGFCSGSSSTIIIPFLGGTGTEPSVLSFFFCNNPAFEKENSSLKSKKIDEIKV